jgi:hypothetical protein
MRGYNSRRRRGWRSRLSYGNLVFGGNTVSKITPSSSANVQKPSEILADECLCLVVPALATGQGAKPERLPGGLPERGPRRESPRAMPAEVRKVLSHRADDDEVAFALVPAERLRQRRDRLRRCDTRRWGPQRGRRVRHPGS